MTASFLTFSLQTGMMFDQYPTFSVSCGLILNQTVIALSHCPIHNLIYLKGSGKLIDTMANVSIFGGNFFIM